MKLLSILYLLCALCLCSCGDGMDTYKCYLSAKAKAGDGAEVVSISSFTFLARKPDGSIWRYKNMHAFDAEVSEEQKLMDAPVKK